MERFSDIYVEFAPGVSVNINHTTLSDDGIVYFPGYEKFC